MFTYEATYKHKKSGDVFKLWTSKHGIPRITRFKENGEAIMSFEFSSVEERTQAINKAMARGSITVFDVVEKEESLDAVISKCAAQAKNLSGANEKPLDKEL